MPPDRVEIVQEGDGLAAVWYEGPLEVRRDRMGRTPREIGDYYRVLLARQLGTTVGSPAYRAFVDRAFGGD